jgi:hypothetical protein
MSESYVPNYKRGDIILETGSGMLCIVTGFVDNKMNPVPHDSKDAAWYSLFVPGDDYCSDGKRRYYKIKYADHKWLVKESEKNNPFLANKVG